MKSDKSLASLYLYFRLVWSSAGDEQDERRICDHNEGRCYSAVAVGTGPFAYCPRGLCVQGRCMGGKCYSRACNESDQNSCPFTDICDKKSCRLADPDERQCFAHSDCSKPGKCVLGRCYNLKYPREFACLGNLAPDVNHDGSIRQCKIRVPNDCSENYYCVGYQGSNVGQIGYCCPRTDLMTFNGLPAFEHPTCPYDEAWFYSDHGWECDAASNNYFAHYDFTVKTKRKFACCKSFCDYKDEFFDGKKCRTLQLGITTCQSDYECPGKYLFCIKGKCSLWFGYEHMQPG